MRIAVIDDGVNERYIPSIGKLCFDMEVNSRNEVVRRRSHSKLVPSHATTCAGIIRKYAPNSEIGSIKIISDSTMRGNVKHLLTALRWCFDHDIKMINMSIGSCDIKDAPSISDAVRALTDSGCVVVAALANNMKYSLPACLGSVLSVRTSSILKNDQFLYDNGGLFSTNFVASSLHELTNFADVIHTTSLCNSYAAPLITAKAHQCLEKDGTLSAMQIRKMLGGIGRMQPYGKRLKKTPLLSNIVDIPIICICGSASAAGRAAVEMNRLFLNRGYCCVAFTNDSNIETVGFIPIPTETKTMNLFAFFASYLKLDLILLVSNSFANADATLKLSNEIARSKYSGDEVLLPENFTDYQIKNTVKYFERRGK